MHDGVTSPQQLALAISGLAGIVGWLLWPTVASWLAFLVGWLDTGRSVLAGRRSWWGLGLLRAGLYSTLLMFVFAGLLRAVGELRQVRVEAPVFTDMVTGLLVGMAIWGLYAVIVRVLRRDLRRARHERRFGSFRM
ncbi:MAG: hypothetical protein V3V08_17545 [Nannocystaceae bacterium]